ncbi:chymotrypsin family serine protease [Glycomyces tarimensis]
MKYPIVKRALIALAATVLLLASPAAVSAQDDDPGPKDGYQTPEEGLKDDISSTAETRGWTFEQAEAQYKVTEAIGDIAAEIAPERLDVFVGTALSEQPGGTPTLYIKGEADEYIYRVIKESGQEVAVADGQPFSYLELEERNTRLNEQLTELGYVDFSSGFDITKGTISAELAAQADLPTDPEQIRERLSKEFHRGVELAVVDKLGNTAEHGYGGMAAHDGGAFECTTGWTVVNPSGVTGVTTAGHCTGIDQTWQPGYGFVDLDFQSQFRGYWGDIEWHTTPTHIDVAEFYAHPNTRRDTLSVEPWWGFTVGESICVYGRSTNSRQCGLDVQNPWWSCTLDGYLTESLVRMDGDVTIGGDSGGGWSWNNRAYGSHVGDCSWQNVFSRADDFNEAIGVSVLL